MHNDISVHPLLISSHQHCTCLFITDYYHPKRTRTKVQAFVDACLSSSPLFFGLILDLLVLPVEACDSINISSSDKTWTQLPALINTWTCRRIELTVLLTLCKFAGFRISISNYHWPSFLYPKPRLTWTTTIGSRTFHRAWITAQKSWRISSGRRRKVLRSLGMSINHNPTVNGDTSSPPKTPPDNDILSTRLDDYVFPHGKLMRKMRDPSKIPLVNNCSQSPWICHHIGRTDLKIRVSWGLSLNLVGPWRRPLRDVGRGADPGNFEGLGGLRVFLTSYISTFA